MHRRKRSLMKQIEHPAVELGIYPNKKEWSEAQAMLRALDHLSLSFGDSSVVAVCIGDGQTPRCGALIAAETAWTVYSIDPALRSGEKSRLARSQKRYPFLKRLHLIPDMIENCSIGLVNRAVIIACHCHATVDAMMGSVSARQLNLVCMPCCVDQSFVRGYKPDLEYEDLNVSSPQRTVKIWKRFEIYGR